MLGLHLFRVLNEINWTQYYISLKKFQDYGNLFEDKHLQIIAYIYT